MNDEQQPEPSAPRSRIRPVTLAAAAGVAGLVLGLGGIASAQTVSPAPSPSTSAPSEAEDKECDKEDGASTDTTADTTADSDADAAA